MPSSACLEDIDELCRLFADLRRSQPKSILLDTSRVETISPTGLVLMTAIADELAEPEALEGAQGPATYFAAGAEQLALPLWGSPISEAEGAGTCHDFIDAETAAAVADAITLDIEKLMAADAASRSSIHHLISELTRNVIDHSQARRGFAAAWPITDLLLELAIYDRGVGIPRTVPPPDDEASLDDPDALELAISPQVSSSPVSTGLGLFFTRHLVVNNGGTLLIRSGSGSLVCKPDAPSRATGARPPLAGTLVAIQIRLDKTFDHDLLEQELRTPAGVQTSNATLSRQL